MYNEVTSTNHRNIIITLMNSNDQAEVLNYNLCTTLRFKEYIFTINLQNNTTGAHHCNWPPTSKVSKVFRSVISLLIVKIQPHHSFFPRLNTFSEHLSFPLSLFSSLTEESTPRHPLIFLSNFLYIALRKIDTENLL